MYLFDQFSEEGEEAGVGHLCGAVPSCSQQRPQTRKKGLLNIDMLTPGLQGKHNALDTSLFFVVSWSDKGPSSLGKQSRDTSGTPHNFESETKTLLK